MRDRFSEPLLITGLPRSGTSLVAGILGQLGLWLGTTVPGGPANPKGFFEHIGLREQANKRILARLGCDPLGVRKLPLLSNLPRVDRFREHIKNLLDADHYDDISPWGFKDAKLTLLWPVWRDAFPEAQWLVVHRPRELVIRSCLKTHFMRQHSGKIEFWENFCDEYDCRLYALRKAVPSTMQIDASRLIDGDYDLLINVVERMGLTWNTDRVTAFIDPAFWGDRHTGTAQV